MKKFDITILLDRSGSMQERKEDHIGGLRSFINDQKDTNADFTFIQFDSHNPFEIIYDSVDINTINTDEISLIPRGSTPLLDAVGKTIAHIENKNNKESQIVLMILTDGLENSSREWDKKSIENAIKSKKDWQIMYLAANIDAFSDGYIGTSVNKTMNFANTAHGIKSAYSNSSEKIKKMRAVYTSGGCVNAALSAGDYTQQDRIMCADGNETLSNTYKNIKE